MNSVTFLQNISIFVSIFYFCLFVYSLYLALRISGKKKPIVTNNDFFNTVFLLVLSMAGYFLFYNNQTIVVTVTYVLFVFGLFLLIIVSKSKFRIIGSEERVHPILKKALFKLNIPFVNDGNKFDLLGLGNAIIVKKTLFSTFHVILKNGKDQKVLNKIQAEFRVYYENNDVVLYKRGINIFFACSFLFLIFCGLCTFYSIYCCL